jgi:hypothetical protein
MQFPSKKSPRQKLIGYVRLTLPLIEQEFKSGIPMTEIHAAIVRDAGFGCSYNSYANTLSKARKAVAQEIATSATGEVSRAAQGAPQQVESDRGGRSFKWNPPDGNASLDAIFKKST